MPPRPRFVSAACLAAVILTLSGPAAAFRPSSRWLLDQAMQRQLARGIRTLDVEQDLTLHGLPTAPKGLEVSQRTVVVTPDKTRRSYETAKGRYLEVRTAKKTLIESPGGSAQARKTRPDFVADFLTAGKPLQRQEAAERLLADLKKIGVDPDAVAYGRFDGRVNYVIGAKPWEAEKPQVWLDKETLHLTRVITRKKTADGDIMVDTRLRGWGSPEGGSWFPKTLEVWEDGTLKERALTRSVERNETVDRALFNIE